MSRPHGGGQPGAVRTLFALVGGALDGFVVGFTVAFIVATALSGVGRALGLGPIGDMAASLGTVLVAVGIPFGILAGVKLLAGRIRDRLDRAIGLGRLPRRLGTVLALPFRIVAALPRTLLLMVAVLLVIFVVAPVGPGKLLAPDGVLAPYLWFGGLVGSGVGLARTGARRLPETARVPRAATIGLGIVVAIGVAVAGIALFLDPGTDAHLVRPTAALDGTSAPSGLGDPGAPGSHSFTTFTYGSGTDRRPPFGEQARIRTPTVDASRALGQIGWGADEARRWFWGFGPEDLPLNGRVWLPDGDGPFPLVLIVHGNHAMGAENEAGYAYLGEHLASRGFIAASVDESFLNGSWAGDYLGNEQAVRAWLLLLHLDQWRAWNAEPGGLLAGRVDMDRVALIGHSRGGEAAAVAASLAGLDGSFNPTLRPWPTGLAVKAVVAIAPSDGQYSPAVQLEGVDLLELTGGHDADARAWSGIRQYNRTTVDEGGFKAALYAYRANHGQFNTVWGRGDQGPWSGALLNLRPLLDSAEQEDVARTSISAFLEASLNGREEYRALFARPMTGREWLPDDVYLVRSDDGRQSPLVDVAEDGRPVDGLVPIATGLRSARNTSLPLRALQDTQVGKVVMLAWDTGPGEATWGVSGLAAARGIPPASGTAELRMALANATPPVPDGGQVPPPLDPLVEVTTSDGVTVALPLSTWGALPPPLTTRLVKNEVTASIAGVSGLDLGLRSPAETVIQGYAIPLSAFVAANPAFVPERLDRVVLRIPTGTAGDLAVAGFALAPGP